MFSVLIRERGGGVRTVAFDKPEVSVGRIQGNDIVLPKGNISKRHARIVHRDDDFVVVDLRSTNGTYVNGHKVTAPMVVSEDDKLYVGDFILQVRRGDAVEGEGANGANGEADSAGAEEIPAAADAPPSDGDANGPVASAPAEEAAPEAPPAAEASAEESSDSADAEPMDLGVHDVPQSGIPTQAAMDVVSQPAPERIPTEVPEAPAPAAAAPVATEPPAAAPEPAPAPVAAPPEPVAAPQWDQEELSDFELQLRAVDFLLERALRHEFFGEDLDNVDIDAKWADFEGRVFALVEASHRAGEIPDSLDLGALTTDILYELTALGAIENLLADDSISAFFAHGSDQIWTVRGGERQHESEYAFSSAASYERIVSRLVSRSGEDSSMPVATGYLDDGTWFHVVRQPAAVAGPHLHVVKPPAKAPSLPEWKSAGRIGDAEATALEDALATGHVNIAVAASTAESAAEFTSALAGTFAAGTRIALLEGQPRVASSDGALVVRFNPSDADAVEAAARSGADWLVAADVDAFTLAELIHLGAVRSGGIIMTIRANNPGELPARLRAMQDSGLTKEAALVVAGAALDLVVFVTGSGADAKVSSVQRVSSESLAGLSLEPVGEA